MATRVADRAVLDTNVLLAATDLARPDHVLARETVEQWPASGTALYTSGQILREYLVVATRPVQHNGLGLAQADALSNVLTLRRRMRLAAESEKVTERLLALLTDIDCRGKQIHDANIVATMLVYGIDTLVTFNVDDFTRFAAHVRVIRP